MSSNQISNEQAFANEAMSRFIERDDKRIQNDIIDKIKQKNMTIQEKYKHINLMPFQWDPFNGDTFLCDEIRDIQIRTGIEKAIELGTCLGSTALFLGSIFRIVATTEINRDFYNVAYERMHVEGKIYNPAKSEGVIPYNEDSRSILEFLMPSNDPILIFIDSHWGPSNPLLQELDIIAASGNKNVVLVIHDFKVPGHPELGYDTYPQENIVYEWNWIESRIEKIYGKENFNHYYNSEATGAKRGVVFIEPKI